MSGRSLGNSLLVVCAVASTGCSAIQGVLGVTGSGVPASESRRITEPFTKIQDDGPVNVNVQVGPAVSLRIEGDDNIVPLIRTEVENGALVINTKRSVRPQKKLTVTLTVPKLDNVSLNGAGNVRVDGIQSDNFCVSLDGAGNIELGGSAHALSASLDGAGNLRLYDLRSVETTVTVDGAGNAELWATNSLVATIDGVGSIKYKGDPQVTGSVNGVGKIERI